MPQELQVLRCYSCHFFQVHIVKKSRKWECKMCGEKQSMKKVYGRGSGQECRAHVQKLNKLAAVQQENQIAVYESSQQCDSAPEDYVESVHGTASADFQHCRRSNPSVSSSSKWSVFLDEPANEDSEEENLPRLSESLNHNAGYSLQSSVESLGNYAFNDTADSNIYKNMQEDSLPNSSDNKWLKYVDRATDIQSGRNIKQLSDHNLNPDREKEMVYDESVLFKRSSNWDVYLEKPTYEAGGSKFVETSAQLMKINKISELLTQNGCTVQPRVPTTAMKSIYTQMFPRKDVTMNVNATAREGNAFDRDYNEDELNSILDV